MHSPDLEKPGSVEEMAEVLRAARGAGRTVFPMGEGSRLDSGLPAARAGTLLVTCGLARIVEYEPEDLTVTVEAGCAVAALDAVLRARGQFLPLRGAEISASTQHGRGRGTVGGLIATAPEGALALGHGGVRDRLLGVKVLLADGSLVKGGGRVVKNVAGYALHRLMIGSFGTLGVIVEASFKVQPLPEVTGTVVFDFGSAASAFAAAHAVVESGMEPVFVNVLLEAPGSSSQRSLIDTYRLAVGFDGSAERVAAHMGGISGIVAPARPKGCTNLVGDESRTLRARLDDPGMRAPRPHTFPGPLDDSGDQAVRPLGEIGENMEAMFARSSEERPAPSTEDSPSGSMEEPLGRSAQSRHLEGCTIRLAALPTRVEGFVEKARETAARFGAALRIDARPGLGSVFLSLEPVDARARVMDRTRSRIRNAANEGAMAEDGRRPGTLGRASADLGARPEDRRWSGAVGPVLAACRTDGGSAVIVSASAEIRGLVDPWGEPPADFALMRRIKTALDPDGVLLGGRFVGGL